MVLPIALSFWWAVFPSITSGIVIVVVILRKWLLKRLKLDWWGSLKLVVFPFLACLPVLMFYLSHKNMPASGFIWQFAGDVPDRFIEYGFNIGLNLVIFTLVYFYYKRYSKNFLPVFPIFLTLCVIMFFPLYRIGKLNDFLFRGMMPCLLIVGIYIFYPLAQATNYQRSWAVIKKTPYSVVIILLLVSSSMVAVARIYRAVTINQATSTFFPDKVVFKPIPYDAYPGIYEALQANWTQEEADQYLGKTDSFYELNLSPEL